MSMVLSYKHPTYILPPYVVEFISGYADNPTIQLVLVLLYHRSLGSESEYYKYICTLPGFDETCGGINDSPSTPVTSSLTVPLYWDRDTLEYIKSQMPRK